jgi:hypothetical protein
MSKSIGFSHKLWDQMPDDARTDSMISKLMTYTVNTCMLVA